jgi:starch-binding outer membrane protein, SusD/RagB family
MKVYNIVLVIFLGMLIGSCKKVLEKNPLDSLTPQQAFATEQNLQLYTNSFYQMVPSAQAIYGESGSLEGYYFQGNILSDNTGWTQTNPYLGSGFTSRNSQGWSWSPLRNINYFLAHYQEAKTTDDRKNMYAGIARFFRAWFYYDKVKMFGDVPWYGAVISSSDSALLYKARDPRTLVMDSVVADLDFAIANLSAIKDNSSSTITKWTALALKSRICLFEGTFRKYHTELNLTGSADKFLNSAAEAAQQLMNSGLYKLRNTGNSRGDYRSLFISSSPVNDEVILARLYSNNLKVWHSATGFFSDFGKYQTFLVKRFVNTYLNKDGSRFTDNPDYNNTLFTDEVKDRDGRLAQTIRTPGYTRSNGLPAPPNLGAARTGYQILKYSLDDPIYDLNGQCYNAIPVIRYAEVLLNYAEAKAELGTFTNDDWDISIALLRKRAGITNTAMPTTMDTYMQDNYYPEISSIAIMEVRRERAIELVEEGFRYDDLRRWKKGNLLEKPKDGIYVPQLNQLMDLNEDGTPDVCFVTANPPSQVPGVYYYKIDGNATKLTDGDKGRIIWQANIEKSYPDYKYFGPLPYNELVINKKLVQNEGWDHP